MTDPFVIITAIALLIWLWLIFLRAGFWRARYRLGRPQQDLVGAPSVVAMVPARNEEETIGQAIASIRAQSHPGDLTTVLIDDQSTDETVSQAKAAGLFDLRVVKTDPLPTGWSGKLWALETGWQDLKARGETPDYIWLSDADIVHSRDVLTALVTKSQARRSALTTLMVRLDARGFWGSLLIPAFVYFFQLIYPFAAVGHPKSRVAGAAGGCILIERAWLEKIGGFAAIKDALIDDCSLARAVKQAGGRLWIGHGTASRSLRDNRSLTSVWTMVRRTAYAQLRFNPFLLLICMAGLVLTFLVPPAALAFGLVTKNLLLLGLGGAGLLLMMISYVPTLRLYGKSALLAITLPCVTALYGLMTMHSAFARHVGRGSSWKGRTYGKD